MFEVLAKGCEPTRGSKYSSCVDLYASEDVVIGAGETKIVPLGVKIDIDKLFTENDNCVDRFQFMASHCLELKCRSSLPLKKGLIIANGVGEIDLDFEDEIGIILHNPLKLEDVGDFTRLQNGKPLLKARNSAVSIIKGDKIAQIKLVEHKSYLFGIESDEVRDGGFGSTDKKDDIVDGAVTYGGDGSITMSSPDTIDMPAIGNSAFINPADMIQQSDGTFVCNIKGENMGKIFILNDDNFELQKDDVHISSMLDDEIQKD